MPARWPPATPTRSPRSPPSSATGWEVEARDPDVEETGDTFEANALLKARALPRPPASWRSPTTRASRSTPSTARPGIHSARWTGEERLDPGSCGSSTACPRPGGAAATCAPPPSPGPTAREAVVPASSRASWRRPGARAGSATTRSWCPVEGDGRTFAEMTDDEKHALTGGGGGGVLAELLVRAPPPRRSGGRRATAAAGPRRAAPGRSGRRSSLAVLHGKQGLLPHHHGAQGRPGGPARAHDPRPVRASTPAAPPGRSTTPWRRRLKSGRSLGGRRDLGPGATGVTPRRCSTSGATTTCRRRVTSSAASPRSSPGRGCRRCAARSTRATTIGGWDGSTPDARCPSSSRSRARPSTAPSPTRSTTRSGRPTASGLQGRRGHGGAGPWHRPHEVVRSARRTDVGRRAGNRK